MSSTVADTMLKLIQRDGCISYLMMKEEGVKGRLKAAIRGRVKSGHFERKMVGHVDSWISEVLESKEFLHGELSQNGNGTGDIDAEAAWLV